MILRDPVHGLVSFESREERIVPRLMDTDEVQRLRRVRQLGVTALAFPGAEHTRFSHAIGAAHVMKLLIARLRGLQGDLPQSQWLTEERARDALAAALLHDVGHGPLSHLFEDAVHGIPHHEAWTERVVLDPASEVHRVLASYDAEMPVRVASLVRGEYPIAYLAKAVSGTFDVDRCDYLLRDAHATGVRYGLFDLDWMLRSLRFAPSTVVSGSGAGSAGGAVGASAESAAAPALAIDGAKGLPAIEAFILARLFMFQQIYLHKATRAAEWMIRTVLARAARLLADGATLPEAPLCIVRAARGEAYDLHDYLELDDGVLAVAMHAWEKATAFKELADLSERVRRRKLFKTLELFGDQATQAGRTVAFEVARDVAKRRGYDPEMYVGLDVASDTPFDVENEPIVVYAKGRARPLGDVSFLLGRLKGQTLSRTRLIFAAELREDIVRAVGV